MEPDDSCSPATLSSSSSGCEGAGPFLGRALVPIPTGQEAAAFDAWAIQERGVPDPVLMENAGRSAALLLNDLVPQGPVLVLAGPGNNGGDGVVLARSLATWGREVHLVVVGDRPSPDPLLHDWSPTTFRRFGDGELSTGLEGLLAQASVVVDGLLGTGITGVPREPFSSLIEAANTSGTPILALDLPSGVDADTGAGPGVAIQAHWTVAFGGPKRGTLLHPGRARAGRLLAVEIGFPPIRFGAREEESSGRLLTPGWAAREMPRRALVTHKNAAGRLLLMAGEAGMAGAVILAARAALRSGVGFLRIATPLAIRDVVQSAVPEAIHLDADDLPGLREGVGASDALAVGPGMGTGPNAQRRLQDLLAAWREVGQARNGSISGEGSGNREGASPFLILDADALNLVAKDESGELLSGEVDSWRPGPDGLLLTPHPGEARRLFPPEQSRDDEGGDPAGWARALARKYDAGVLLKGNPSVLATPIATEPVLYSATASSHLARAGMGDVLTGCIGGLAAQGVSPVTAGGLALHLTGRAAMLTRGKGGGPLPQDLVEALPAALAEVGPGRSSFRHPFLLLDLPAPW
jgi:ADP-dependent NAD(P)H-hydrate dehydratase / NAD(P)H-hydrate epimerase